jgi:hypothetical protein
MTVRRVDLSDDYETTVYDAARRLLAAGADPADTVETVRGGVLSMSGVIGKLARWQVEFRASGPCLTRYRSVGTACVAAKSAAPVPKRLAQRVGHYHSFPSCSNLKRTTARKRAAACEGNRP